MARFFFRFHPPMTHCHEQFHVTSYAFFAGTIHVYDAISRAEWQTLFSWYRLCTKCLSNAAQIEKSDVWGVNSVIVNEIESAIPLVRVGPQDPGAERGRAAE